MGLRAHGVRFSERLFPSYVLILTARAGKRVQNNIWV